MILQPPGSTVCVILPSSRVFPEEEWVYAHIRVMTHGDKTWFEGLSDQGLGDFEIARRTIGRLVVELEGLKNRDGSEFKLQREPDGALTKECAAQILPMHVEICMLIRNGAILTETERKNS